MMLHYMKKILLAFMLINSVMLSAQPVGTLNTAKNCGYMKPAEQEMIYEINRLRTNPRSYLPYIEPLLKTAKNVLKNFGKGDRSYSLTFRTTTIDRKAIKQIDTNWHYTNEEEVKALTTLVSDLKRIKKLSLLQPDSGIYNAARKHAKDQDAHEWGLMHTGSDGSSPWDRITQFSPSMSFGNENIAGRGGLESSARSFMIQL